MRAAQDLRRRAREQPGLNPFQRANLRRIARNLVGCNMLEAKRRLGLYGNGSASGEGGGCRE